MDNRTAEMPVLQPINPIQSISRSSKNSRGIMNEEFKITRRHLPHWTLRGATYFVTFCTRNVVLNEKEQLIVLEHIRDGNGRFYNCYAGIVMPDHVHLLFQIKKGYTLSRVMRGIKGASAHKINQHRGTQGQIWQNESYDRIVRNGKEFDVKLNYMFNNPLKKGLTDDPSNYVGWYFNKDIFRRSDILV
jgi:putative transposase